jgi:protocatechuate 3,4-dioxygenase beta subunit
MARLDSLVALSDREIRPTAQGQVEVLLGDAVDTHPLVMTLQQGYIISGKVSEITSGDRLKDATIDYFWFLPEIKTAADGTFTLAPMPAGSYTCTMKKAGYYNVTAETTIVNADPKPLDIKTGPEGVVKGHVLDEQGHPIPHCYVMLDHGPVEVPVNAQGAYEFHGFDPNQHINRLFANTDANYDLQSKDNISIPLDTLMVTVDFILHQRAVRTISGTVKFADGTPAVFVRVDSATTDASGSFVITNADISVSMIQVSGKGIAPAWKCVAESGEDTQVDIVVEKPHRLDGTLVDEHGKPIAGARLGFSVDVTEEAQRGGYFLHYHLSENKLINQFEVYTVITDHDGHFTFTDLPTKGAMLDGWADGYSPLWHVPITVDAAQSFVMKRYGRVTGQVLRADNGLPVKEFTIRSDIDRHGKSFTTTDGTFTLPNMTTGDLVRLVVDAPGCSRLRIDPVTVSADGQPITVTMPPAPPFVLQTRDAQSGQEIPGVSVTFLDPTVKDCPGWRWDDSMMLDNWYPVTYRTDDHGRLSLPSAPTPTVFIMLEHPDYGRIYLHDIDGSKPLMLQLAPAATLTGKVVEEAGKPLVNAHVFVKSTDGKITFYNIRTGLDGTIRNTSIAPGKYMIEGYKHTLQIELHPGEFKTLDWDQPSTTRLEGKIIFANGPVAGASLFLYPNEGGLPCSSTTVNADGSYRLNAPDGGYYGLTISKSENALDNKNYRRQIFLAPGVNTLDFIWPASLSGDIVDAKTGKPVAKSQLSVYLHAPANAIEADPTWYNQYEQSQWWPCRVVSTDDNGHFAIDDLPSGECLVALEDDTIGVHRGPISQPFTLTEHTRINVRLEFPETGTVCVDVRDARSGERVPQVLVTCTTPDHFTFYPDLANGEKHPDGLEALLHAQRDTQGRLLFSHLPPGHYTVYPMLGQQELPGTGAYLPSSAASIDVTAGETSAVTLNLEHGGRVVYQIQADLLRNPADEHYIGFRSVRIGAERTAPLTSAFGPQRGDMIPVSAKAPYQAVLCLQPGTYRIESVLLAGQQSKVIRSTDRLWHGVHQITVVEDEDTLIRIPNPRATTTGSIDRRLSNLRITRIAILPMDPRTLGQATAEALCRQIGTAYRTANPTLTIMSPTEAAGVLRETPSCTAVMTWIHADDATRRMNSQDLERIGRLLNVDAIVICGMIHTTTSAKPATTAVISLFGTRNGSCRLLWSAEGRNRLLDDGKLKSSSSKQSFLTTIGNALTSIPCLQ